MKKQLIIIGIILFLFAVFLTACIEEKKIFLEENEILIENNSMSHGESSEIGVIDKGDIVQYNEINNRSEIITWAYGRLMHYKNYGDYGDVIVFNCMNNQIVHRAMCLVEYNVEYGTYTLQDYGLINVSNITITEFGLYQYKPNTSGFITKADNSPICDQASSICNAPVKFEWIVGTIVKLQDN
jgi:signal peptidase I